MKTKKFFLLVMLFFLSSFTFAQTIYTWKGAGGADWTISSNWTPSRNIPATNDILLFNDGRTISISNIPTQTIGRLMVTGNTNLSLQTNSVQTLSVNGPTATSNIVIESGSTLQLSSTGANKITLTYTTTTGQLADISGSLIINANTNSDNTFNTNVVSANSIVSSTGEIINNGGIVTGAAPTGLRFSNGSEYRHNMNGGIIPTATWEASSLANIIGIITTSPTGLNNQTLGMLTWNCTAQTNAINLVSAASFLTLNGDFRVASTNTGALNIGNGFAVTLNTNADFIIQSGIVNLNNAGMGITTFNCARDFLLLGGTFQTGASAGAQALNFVSLTTQDFFHSAGIFLPAGINYSVSSPSRLTINNPIVILVSRTFTIATGATVTLSANITDNGTFTNNGTLNCGTSIISGSGTFSSTGTLGIGDIAGITTSPTASGNIRVTGTRTFGASNYIYNGSSAQVTGNGLPASIARLTIENPFGVTLTSSITNISTGLILNSGLLTLSANNITLATAATITGNTFSTTNMIVADGAGQLIKNYPIGVTPAFTFPIGDNTGTAEYSPVSLGFTYNVTAGTVGVRVVDDIHPSIVAVSNYQSRYFVFSNTLLTNYFGNVIK